jgi:hypothetical protein
LSLFFGINSLLSTVNSYYINPLYMGKSFIFKEQIMAKGSSGSNGGGGKGHGGGSAPRGGKGGMGFIPSRPGGNKPSMTGNPSGLNRGNLPPKG